MTTSPRIAPHAVEHRPRPRARYGDLEWAARTHGSLSGFAKVQQIVAAIAFRLSQRYRKRPRALGAASPSEVERMMGEIQLPATPLVARAAALVNELGPPPLTGHVLRTWAWGAVLAIRDGLSLDRETFALAALLHDLALARRTAEVTCFAADGAEQAVSLLRGWGAPEPQSRAVGDAICLHVRVDVPVDYGVEAHLVHAGAGIDVIGGSRFADIPREVRARILATHPRGRLKALLVEKFRREQTIHPSSRMALWASMGFLDRIERAPFEELGAPGRRGQRG